jgi:hypothetical protein
MISDELNRHGRLGIAGGESLELDIVPLLAPYHIMSVKRGEGAMKEKCEGSEVLLK